MKYFSEILNQKFDTVEELLEAEKKEEKAREEMARLKAEKVARAKEIEAAYKKVEEAIDDYNKLVAQFIKTYGSYHSTVSKVRSQPMSLFDVMFNFFR